jgi:hypothetical protein
VQKFRPPPPFMQQPPPQPSQQQGPPRGFQTEELFWSDGAAKGAPPAGSSQSAAGPTLGPFGAPNSGQPEEQELFWGGADAPESQPPQWGGAGGIFSGGLPGGSHPQEQSWAGQGGAHQGNHLSQGWNMGPGNMGFAPSLSADEEVEAKGNSAGSPSEYQPHHLVGDSLSALLDDDYE